MKNTRTILVLAVLALIVMIFFWPTLYRYDKLGDKLTRTNRITGQTQEFMFGQWTGGTRRTEKISLPEKLSYEEMKQITGKAQIYEFSNEFSADLYNGSSNSFQFLTVRIILKEKNGSVRWDRKYTASSLFAISPQSSGTVRANLSDCQGFGTFTWQFEAIY